MKRKVLILGSTGMLGHQVYYHFKDNGNYEVINFSYRNQLTSETIILDLKNKSDLEKLLKNQNPDFIVNCVGVLINEANDNPANAIYLNSYLPHFLAGICDEINAKLIHISTDCVFSGEKGNYTETDETDGKDIYAKTKALGEVINSNHLTLRTSIIGPELKKNGEGLFHWFMQQSGSVYGYTNAIWSGVTTLELAKAIMWGIENKISGLYHITNNTSINKNELLNLFKKFTNRDIEIIPHQDKISDKSFIDTRRLLTYDIPDYEFMIQEMVEQILSKRELYHQYKV